MEKVINNWRDFVYKQHDVVCNQKYDGLPYSKHLEFAERQCTYMVEYYELQFTTYEKDVLKLAIIGHDLMEDARMTYNNIYREIEVLMMLLQSKYKNSDAIKMCKQVADIIYCVTDEKGKNRKERKNDKYYEELSKNRLAVFVKLSDIAVNRMYSKLTRSSMYDKYVNEFVIVESQLFREEYKDFFELIKNI